MADTRIEWADAVWNPITGCTKVSPGCKNCYAERMATRLQAMGQPHYKDGFAVRLHLDALVIPTLWRKPRRIFVNSMSDLFHEAVPDSFVYDIWYTMRNTPQHTYMALTKRPDRMQAYFTRQGYDPLPNLWLGTSVENADYLWRISDLSNTPAALRFLSLEPLLGPIDVSPWLNPVEVQDSHGIHFSRPPIDWVIVGGESGPKARPMHPQWARDIRDQCISAGVPFFFKQRGEWVEYDEDDPIHVERISPRMQRLDGAELLRVGKKRAGRLLDGREWNEIPGEVPCSASSASA